MNILDSHGLITFPVAAPLTVVSAREIEARRGASGFIFLCCTSHGRECEGDRGIYLSWSRERQEEEAWKRSDVVIVAALEDG